MTPDISHKALEVLRAVAMIADQEPLGEAFEAVWDENRDTLYEP